MYPPTKNTTEAMFNRSAQMFARSDQRFEAMIARNDQQNEELKQLRKKTIRRIEGDWN